MYNIEHIGYKKFHTKSWNEKILLCKWMNTIILSTYTFVSYMHLSLLYF